MDKPLLHTVSLSGGKDSTAMVLKMIEQKMPIDVIFFCDTGIEFPSLYKHIDKLNKYIKEKIGIEITILKEEKGFEYWLCDYVLKNKSGIREKIHGYGWPHMKNRWCTHKLKKSLIDNYLEKLKSKYTIIQYIGLAYDEHRRLNKLTNISDDKHFPLVDFKMTEKECLRYCKDNGFDWDGLYDHFDRCGCWCCPVQSIDDLRSLYTYYPELFKQLLEWDKKTWNPYYNNVFSVEDLVIRFELEKEWKKQGKKITGKEFQREFKRRMGWANIDMPVKDKYIENRRKGYIDESSVIE